MMPNRRYLECLDPQTTIYSTALYSANNRHQSAASAHGSSSRQLLRITRDPSSDMVALPADAALVRTPLPDHDESRGACAAESRPMSHPAATADTLADDCHQRRHRRRAAPCLSDSARLISALSSALFSASLSRASSTRSRPCCSPIAAACAATYSLTTWRTCEHGTRVHQVLGVNGSVATSISRVN